MNTQWLQQKRRLAKRVDDIAPFHVMQLLARARQMEAAGESVVHMEIGEPDFATPQPVIDAATAFIRKGQVHYTPACGLPALREQIAQWCEQRYGVNVSPQRIIITAGASGALQLVLGLLVNPGDEVLLPDPGYPCNRHFVRVFEGVANSIAVTPDNNYQPTLQQLAQHCNERVRALLLASPANPTGTMLSGDALQQMQQFCADRGVAMIVDEIYHGLTHEFDAPTALQYSDDVFVINSFSKYFSMTGWRLGWVVAPADCVADMEKLAGNLFICPPAPAQHAALAAFQPQTIAILEQRRHEFRRRRDFLLPQLTRLGFDVRVRPQGAFYIYADSSALAADSFAFSRDLLQEAAVAITPGLDFGANAAENHVRFACTVSEEMLAEGVARIERFIERG